MVRAVDVETWGGAGLSSAPHFQRGQCNLNRSEQQEHIHDQVHTGFREVGWLGRAEGQAQVAGKVDVLAWARVPTGPAPSTNLYSPPPTKEWDAGGQACLCPAGGTLIGEGGRTDQSQVLLKGPTGTPSPGDLAS